MSRGARESLRAVGPIGFVISWPRRSSVPDPRAACAGGLHRSRPGMTSEPAPLHPPGSSPILTLRISVRGLYDSWAHCHRLAEYIARFVASDRFDPEQLTTRLSTYLNEVLEYVFRARPSEGEIVVEVVRTDEHVIAELTMPTDDALAERLREDLGRAAQPDARARYEAEFQAMLARPPAEAGLLELVALHGVALALRERSGASVIVLTVPHE